MVSVWCLAWHTESGSNVAAGVLGGCVHDREA